VCSAVPMVRISILAVSPLADVVVSFVLNASSSICRLYASLFTFTKLEYQIDVPPIGIQCSIHCLFLDYKEEKCDQGRDGCVWI